MAKQSIVFLGLLTSCVLLMSGCDKTKEPLSGKREALFFHKDTIQVDESLKYMKPSISTAQDIAEWPLSGGNAWHLMPASKVGMGKLEKNWKTSIGQASTNSQKLIANMVSSKDYVYANDATGKVSAVDLNTGKIVWAVETAPKDMSSDALGAGLALEADQLFVTTSFAEVICLNAQTGKEVWRQKALAPIRTAPTASNGRLYVVTINNELMAFDSKTGALLWSHAGITEAASLLGGASPAVSGDVVIAVYSSGEVYALKVENGHPIWSDTLTSALRFDSVSGISHIRARPIVDGHNVYVISHGGRMLCLDLHTGIRKWVREIAGMRTPAFNNNVLYVLTNEQEILAMKADTGQVYWISQLPKQDKSKDALLWSGPLIVDQTILLTNNIGELVRVDPATGQILTTTPIKESITLSSIVTKGHLLMLSDEGNLLSYKEQKQKN